MLTVKTILVGPLISAVFIVNSPRGQHCADSKNHPSGATD